MRISEIASDIVKFDGFEAYFCANGSCWMNPVCLVINSHDRRMTPASSSDSHMPVLRKGEISIKIPGLTVLCRKFGALRVRKSPAAEPVVTTIPITERLIVMPTS